MLSNKSAAELTKPVRNASLDIESQDGKSCRCYPQVPPGPVRGHHCQDRVQSAIHFQRNRKGSVQIRRRDGRGVLREDERNVVKENDDARVSKEFTDIVVEHFSDEKAETTETVEELESNDKVESTELVIQSSVVICSESVKNFR